MLKQKTRGNSNMPALSKSKEIIDQTSHYGANNYHPLPIVISEALGAWVKDPEGNEYMDMLSAYSAVNQGHRHPKIIQALKDQADKITLTSRAFHNDQLGPFYEKTAKLTGKEMILPMNTGAEAVESAVKAARRWAYEVKGVADNQAEIIACVGNFHGRTMLAVSLSSEEEYKRGFGPMLPGIKLIPYGDVEALRQAITPNTAAFLFEPIQGEAGIVIPLKDFYRKRRRFVRKRMSCLLRMKFRRVSDVQARRLPVTGTALFLICIFWAKRLAAVCSRSHALRRTGRS